MRLADSPINRISYNFYQQNDEDKYHFFYLIVLFITLIFVFFIPRGQDAVNLYSNAKAFGLTSSGYIWVVSSEAAQGIALENAPQGET